MSLARSGVALMIPVTDVARSTQFYRDSLGLEFTGTNDEGSAAFAVGSDSQLLLLPRPESHPSESTAMSFEVDDVSREIGALEGRGVVFEDYDLPELTTVDHVAETGSERAAWFKDPDGNILCLHQDLT
jgi:catechol 2,3-dioxygenase-like lactoylglutathione lyase family enzyme